MTAYRFLWALALSGNVLLAAEPVMAQGSELNLDIVAKCESTDAQFEIVNKGERWPGMATIFLLRADNHAVISQRQLRMTVGQRIVFRAREAPDTIGVGLWINPDWYKREFMFDAVIHCE
ncbi:MAG: hypothetical protein FJX37_12825 [Alphaproteobacteria bacterium]|nr:hypothetical protein [Alphaproteobacteria bacterium]MBM3950360.1 hypothetical protein [Rhodospirillales bacterium]